MAMRPTSSSAGMARRLLNRDLSWTCPQCKAQSLQQKQLETRRQYTTTDKRRIAYRPSRLQKEAQTAVVSELSPGESNQEGSVADESLFEVWRRSRVSQSSKRDNIYRYSTRNANEYNSSLNRSNTTTQKDQTVSTKDLDLSAIEWIEQLRKLNPSLHLSPHHKIHNSLSTHTLKRVGAYSPAARKRWQNALDQWLESRQAAGDLTFTEYRMLLQYAAQIGERALSDRIWPVFSELYQPDTACYNARMEVILFDESKRITQFRKSRPAIPKDERAYAPHEVTIWHSGAFPEISELFKAMTQRSIPRNTTTYGILMLACARDGNVANVFEVMKRIWSVDVPALARGADFPSDLPELDTVTRPTQALLHTIADIFGTINQIPLGLSIIDGLSIAYSIPITTSTWSRLQTWSSLHARLQKDSTTRRAAAETSARLFEIAMGPGYAVKPSLELTHHAAVSLRALPLLGDPKLLHPIEVAREIQLSRIARARLARRRAASQPDSPAAQRVWRAAETQRMLGHAHLARLVRGTLRLGVSDTGAANATPEQRDSLQEWRERGLPDFVARYAAFVPGVFSYQTSGGTVTLRFRTEEDVFAARERDAVARRRVGVRWLRLSQSGSFRGRKWGKRIVS